MEVRDNMFGLTPYNRKNSEILRRGDVMDLRSFVSDFFNDPFFAGFMSAAHPIKADIRETDKEYIIDAEMPGVKKEDIKLELRDGTLTLAVENTQQTDEERENYIRKERRMSSFSRSFYVDNVKNEDVAARYDNGILTITLPKQEGAKENSHRIDIQ